jgi:cytochrome c oxidase subunit IV
MNEKRETVPDSRAGGVPADPGDTAPEKEFRVYVRVWLGIVILTGVTFTLSRIKAGGVQVLLALLIAGTQAALALYYFMHLRDERAPVFRVLIPLVLVILVVLLALTFSDVAFRG